MTIAQLEASYAAYAAARSAADYDAAIGHLMDICALLAVTPDLEESGGGGGKSVRFRATELDKLIKQCEQLRDAAAVLSGGFQVSKITYARATT